MKTKQVIIVRNDLKMRKGKMSAQVAHASMNALLKSMSYEKVHMITSPTENSYDEYTRTLKYNEFSAMEQWLEGKFTKIVLQCDSLQHLESLHATAVSMKLPCSDIIVDVGDTVFNEPTATCFAIGPEFSDKIDTLTSSLKLML
jgi:PTH2 family peptidyl-tRNA hydrolase